MEKHFAASTTTEGLPALEEAALFADHLVANGALVQVRLLLARATLHTFLGHTNLPNTRAG